MLNQKKENYKAGDKLAKPYEQKFTGMDLYNKSYESFCNQIPGSSPSVPEIGCGPGNITKYIKSYRPEIHIKAIDSSPELIEIAKAHVPDVDLEVMNANAVGKINSRYNGIICGFCIPYLDKEECVALIKNCSLLLNKKGILYISFIKGSYSDSGYESGSIPGIKLFQYYYDELFFIELFSKLNFSTPDVDNYIYFNTNNTKSEHLVLLAK